MKKLFPLVALLLGCACSEGPVPPSTPRPIPTEFVNGGDCAPSTDPSLPARSGCVTTAGDLAVFASLDADNRPVSWFTRVRGVDGVLDAGNSFSYPRALAELDVDDDGDPEWLIKTYDLAGHGTNWQQLGLFVLGPDGVEAVTLEGEALAVRVGGTSRMGEGATCEGGRLIRLRTVAENRQNTRWSYSRTTIRLDGTGAKRGVTSRGVLRLRDYNDPELDPYYAIDCDGFSYP